MKILIPFLLLSHHILLGQHPIKPYEKLNILGTNPDWYETFFDSSLINEKSDGFNTFSLASQIDPIFTDSHIITIRGVLNRNKGNDAGAIIQKREIKTGKIKWSILYDLNTQAFAEVPFKMYLGKDNYLHVHGFRDREPTKPEIFPFLYFPKDSCLLTYRKIDIESGKVIELHTPDENHLNKQMVIASLDRSRKYSNLFLTNNPEEFIYWERIIKENHDVKTVHFQRVNKYGISVSEVDSINLISPTNQFVNFYQLNTDTFIHVNFNRINQKINLYYYNKSFKLIDSTLLENLPSNFNNYTSAKIINDKYIFIQTTDLQIDHNRFMDAVYDLNGKLIDYYEVSSFDFLEYWSSFDFIRKKILVLSSRIYLAPLKYTATLYETKKNGQIHKIYDFTPTDSLRTINGLYLYPVSTSHMLIHFHEGALYKKNNKIEYDDFARAQSLMLFNAADIGLSTVSVKEPHKLSDVLLFPNPAGEEITVQFPEQVSGHGQILDSQGRVHESVDIENMAGWNIPCSGLSPGLYFFRFFNKEGQSVMRRFVRI